MKASKLFTLIPATVLGIVLGVCTTPAFADSPPLPVDDNPPGLFEIGLNEDTLEDVDLEVKQGKNIIIDPRANIMGCFSADQDGALPDACGDHPDEDNGVTSSPPLGVGPDWGDLFEGEMNGADRVYVTASFKDEVEPALSPLTGLASGSNGVPDYLDYGAIAAAFIGDHISAGNEVDDTTLVSSGSDANNHLIETYAWGTDSVPTKDDITNAYCYATENELQQLIVYCGVERLSNDGASHVDIELNKNVIGLDEEPPCDKSVCYMVGERSVGDLLASLDFSNGGDFGSLEIRKWNGTDWGDPVVTLESEGCNSEITNGNTISAGAVCGYNNNGMINGGPWPNFIKDTVPLDTDSDSGGPYTAGMLPRNAFSEFGLNVHEVLGQAQCISTLQIKTRTSPSFTSQLKDFAVQAFPVCGSAIRTEIHDSADTGTPHTDIQGSTVKVGTTIHDFAEVTVTGPGVTTDPQGTVDFYLYDNGTCDGTLVDSHTGVSLVDGTSGDATATAVSKDFSGLSAGTFSIHADFNSSSGDYPDAALAAAHCEVITIAKYESKISTQIHEGTGHDTDIQGTAVNVLTQIHDHAYVEEKTGGYSGAPMPTGNVTFEIYGNATCVGTKLTSYGGISWDQIGALSSGEAETALFTPPAGAFGIKAKYGGDANYLAAVDSSCEPLTVNKLNPSILTKVKVRDLAQVSGSGPTPTGSVTFNTYRSADCSGTAVDTVTLALSSGGAEQGTASEQTLEVGSNVVSYRATYNGNEYYSPVTHDCELVQFSVLTP